jgi:hypothetical protein
VTSGRESRTRIHIRASYTVLVGASHGRVPQAIKQACSNGRRDNYPGKSGVQALGDKRHPAANSPQKKASLSNRPLRRIRPHRYLSLPPLPIKATDRSPNGKEKSQREETHGRRHREDPRRRALSRRRTALTPSAPTHTAPHNQNPSTNPNTSDPSKYN